jgi:transcriptional regulator with XRE-family HTH domain
MPIYPLTPLQALQRTAGLSQEELAERMGLSQTTVSCILRGVYGIERYAEDLAAALDIPVELVRQAARDSGAAV